MGAAATGGRCGHSAPASLARGLSIGAAGGGREAATRAGAGLCRGHWTATGRGDAAERRRCPRRAAQLGRRAPPPPQSPGRCPPQSCRGRREGDASGSPRDACACSGPGPGGRRSRGTARTAGPAARLRPERLPRGRGPEGSQPRAPRPCPPATPEPVPVLLLTAGPALGALALSRRAASSSGNLSAAPARDPPVQRPAQRSHCRSGSVSAAATRGHSGEGQGRDARASASPPPRARAPPSRPPPLWGSAPRGHVAALRCPAPRSRGLPPLPRPSVTWSLAGAPAPAARGSSRPP